MVKIFLLFVIFLDYFRLSSSFMPKLITSILEHDSRGTYLHNCTPGRLFENENQALLNLRVLGSNYGGIKISITIKLTKADI